jgi:hypothetical protein
MKHFISSKMCSNLDEVRHAIALYKQDLTTDKIASFIRHLHEVITL